MIEGYHRDRTTVLSSRSTMQDHKDTNIVWEETTAKPKTHTYTQRQSHTYLTKDGKVRWRIRSSSWRRKSISSAWALAMSTRCLRPTTRFIFSAAAAFTYRATEHHRPSSYHIIYHTIVTHHIIPYHIILFTMYLTIYHIIYCIIYHIKP